MEIYTDGSCLKNPIKDTERKNYAEQVVENEIFPHMGITSSTNEKAYLLGHMVHKLFATYLGLRNPDDRDNYINKRVESPGVLCYELFRQLFKKYTVEKMPKYVHHYFQIQSLLVQELNVLFLLTYFAFHKHI